MQSSRKLTAGVNARLLIFLTATVAALSIWGVTAQMQSREASTPLEAQRKAPTIRASGRGFPHVVFQDGQELSANNNAGTQPTAVAAADFDSDGVADLVSVDQNGMVNLYKGKQRSLNPDPGKSLDAGLPNEDAFAPTGKVFQLAVAPDFFVSGDFNADGHQDILAAAKGDSAVHLLGGNAKGDFTTDFAISVGGSVTAFATGEIGRQDGQTDVAVAVTTRKGAAQLLIFEHPESAFKRPPEVIKLAAPATEVAIGNLDDDFYADVAVGSGNQLTIVHGRGQAYPWDLIPSSGIKRPAAAVETRILPFTISALVVGRFGNQSGQSLAVLGGDGNVYRLEANHTVKPADNEFLQQAKARTVKNLFLPTSADARHLAMIENAPISREVAETNGVVFAEKSEITGDKFAQFLTQRQQEAAEKFKKADKNQLDKLMAEGMPRALEQRAKAREAYLKTIAGRPSTLAQWSLETLVAGSQQANVASSQRAQKMLRVNASDSNLDDILLLDSISNQIQLVSQLSVVSDQSSKANGRRTTANGQVSVTSLEVEGNPLAALPLRLNGDALSDLVVLRKGATVPSVVMSAAASNIFVTSETDIGDCQTGNPCSLRNAILLSNSNPGMDAIYFGLGAGFHTIKPSSQLPTIVDAVFIYGARTASLQPLVEISGENLSGGIDGLKIRTSNTSVIGLAITRFPGVPDANNSLIGGNGIVIESDSGSPNNGNNVIQGNFLGIDQTGSFDKGNDATGLNIFDSDNNFIGGTSPADGNVISGNGSQQKEGVGISVTDGNSNTFQGNNIGLNLLGTGKVGNSTGMLLGGSNNTFGGDDPGAGNTVSGNGEPYAAFPDKCFGRGMVIGVLVNLDTGEFLTGYNTLSGNRFGTNPAGTLGFGNCQQAIYTSPLTLTTIGSITQTGRNVVSDNGLDAIYCDEFIFLAEGGYCRISGNNIGTDVTGTVALPNDWRNQLDGLVRTSGTVDVYNTITLSNVGAPGGTTPNGPCTGFCNLISGNGGDPIGVFASGFGTVGIFSNHIGTNQSGNQVLANQGSGVVSFPIGGEFFVGAGDPTIPFGNLISGNANWGVGAGDIFFTTFLSFGTTYVEANRIGTDISGNNALPNGEGIASVTNYFTRNFIGRAGFASRNIISGNNLDGILIFGLGGQTTVVNNLIGLNSSLNPLGNGRSGIAVAGPGTQIGSAANEDANQIANNGTLGPSFPGVLLANSATGISIRNNSISNNSGLGIDLSALTVFHPGDGVTANDCLDFDEGANDRQNFPMLNAPVFNQNGTVTVTGTLESTPARSFTVDFYSSASADPTGHGEGGIYLGSVNVETNDNGGVLLNFTSTVPVSSSSVISATATDEYGSTSEFSCNAGATCSDSSARAQSDAPLETPLCGVNAIVVNVNTDEENDPVSQSQLKCDVFTEDQPGPQCTLRAALQVARAHEGFDRIEFAIPGSGVHTIHPQTFLFVDFAGLIIDGLSQGGPGYRGSPLIEVSGLNSSDHTGLYLVTGADNVTVRGLAINGFRRANIWLEGNNVRIEACYLGLHADGTPAAVPMPEINNSGIRLDHCRDVTIGGPLPEDGNVISGNAGPTGHAGGNGVHISRRYEEIIIRNNKIGTDPAGMQAIPNSFGIFIDGSIPHSGPFNTMVIERNLISGNTSAGIHNQLQDTPLIVQDNIIGANADLSAALSTKGIGILLATLDSTGGPGTQINRNVIVGHKGAPDDENLDAGIVSYLNNISIQENHIGCTPDGEVLPNEVGIVQNGMPESRVVAQIGRNIIVGNVKHGIHVKGRFNDNGDPIATNSDTKIVGNYIGVNSANDTDLGNGETGIVLDAANRTIIFENIISGNDQYGIRGLGAYNNKIFNNRIGTPAADGHPALPNQIGIRLSASTGNQVYENTISSNQNIGILLGDSAPEIAGTANQKPKARTAAVGEGANTERNQLYSNRVEGSTIGIALTEGANNNYVGTNQLLAGELGNFIVGNTRGQGYGIFVQDFDEGPATAGNTIINNLIGTDSSNEPLPNKVGIVISGAQNNLIGLTTLVNGQPRANPNTIVANLEGGIRLVGEQARGNSISGNYIGVSLLSPEDDRFGNRGDGISLDTTGRNDISNNVIGWNQGNGINLSSIFLQAGQQGFAEVISGNQIGVLQGVNSAERVGNTLAGIRLNETQNSLIGADPNSFLGAKNIIAGNGSDGILIAGTNSKSNLINNSIIGTDEFGTLDIGNGGNGIRIIGGKENTIGGVQSVGNVISGNQEHGILISVSTLNKIYGNRIGLVAGVNGNQKLGNGLHGIKLFETSRTAIGDPILTGYRNFIGGNTNSGIILQGSDTNFTTIKNNSIGTDTVNTNLGNSEHGIFIVDGAAQNVIGGRAEIESGNRIAHNGGEGVRADVTAGCCNLVDPNSIYDNAGLGIDLGLEGITPNDPGDADEGPNRLQNFPEFISAILVGANLVIKYKVDSAPANSNYGTDGLYLEFFEGDDSLEGKTFLESTHYTETNYAAGTPGTATLIIPDATALGIQVGDKLVATATDADGNTSEFTGTNVGTVFGPTAATAIIEGQIVTAAGSPLAGVVIALSGTQTRLTITDETGRFRFTEVETTGFYNVQPSRANFNFTPASRSFSTLGNTTNAAFSAIDDVTQTENPLDTSEYFVRQHYLDFLGREPDESGFNFWRNQILACGNNAGCVERRRINVSAAYFLSIEFQETGGLVDGLYRASYGVRPQFAEFMLDTRAVGRDVVVGREGWQAKLEANKRALVADFVQRPAFINAFGNLDHTAFVDSLISHTGVSFTADERDTLVSDLSSGKMTRAAVLRRMAEDSRFVTAKFNEAFVMMQYFGYLRRDPDENGYQFWLNKLNQFNGNFEQAEMVKAFITSGEYRARFPR